MKQYFKRIVSPALLVSLLLYVAGCAGNIPEEIPDTSVISTQPV